MNFVPLLLSTFSEIFWPVFAAILAAIAVLAIIATRKSLTPQQTGLRVASVIFGIFAIGHLLRLINHAQVTVGTVTIPMGVSWIALIVAAILCIWLWQLASRAAI
jgi:hypothetical protein